MTLGGLAVVAFFIFLPFVTPLLLALLVATVAWPLYQKLLHLVGERRRGIASGSTCAILVLCVALPAVWITWSLAGDAGKAARRVERFVDNLAQGEALERMFHRGDLEAYWERVRAAFASLHRSGAEGEPEADAPADRAGAVPAAAPESPATLVAEPAPGAEATVPLAATAAPEKGGWALPQASVLQLAGWVVRSVTTLLGGVFGFVVDFCLFLFILFYFLRDGPTLVASVGRALPIAPGDQRRVTDTFRSVARSIVQGTLATAIAQGVVATIGFALVGLETPLFWGALVAISSLVPVVGTALVTLPLILSFLVSPEGPQWLPAGTLVAVAAVISALDNLLRPFLLGEGLRLHPLWILLSILGGVSCFGALGLVLGPLVVVFLGTFLALVTEESRRPVATADPAASRGSASAPAEPPRHGRRRSRHRRES